MASDHSPKMPPLNADTTAGLGASNSTDINTDVNTDPDERPPMRQALDQARLAFDRGEVPVGAVLVGPDGRVLSTAGNRTRELNDPTAHAEMLVIRAAARKLRSQRLTGCDLYVTLEPCPMCAAAISFARIRRLYYGASDAKSGGVAQGARIFNQASCHHSPDIYDGLCRSEAAALLSAFFVQRRN